MFERHNVKMRELCQVRTKKLQRGARQKDKTKAKEDEILLRSKHRLRRKRRDQASVESCRKGSYVEKWGKFCIMIFTKISVIL